MKETATKISGEVIPTLMNEMSLSSLKLADGSSVEIKKIYGASIPIEKREAAFNWLRNNDLGDIIKNEITVSFGRNEDNKAGRLCCPCTKSRLPTCTKTKGRTDDFKSITQRAN